MSLDSNPGSNTATTALLSSLQELRSTNSGVLGLAIGSNDGFGAKSVAACAGLATDLALQFGSWGPEELQTFGLSSFGASMPQHFQGFPCHGYIEAQPFTATTGTELGYVCAPAMVGGFQPPSIDNICSAMSKSTSCSASQFSLSLCSAAAAAANTATQPTFLGSNPDDNASNASFQIQQQQGLAEGQLGAVHWSLLATAAEAMAMYLAGSISSNSFANTKPSPPAAAYNDLVGSSSCTQQQLLFPAPAEAAAASPPAQLDSQPQAFSAYTSSDGGDMASRTNGPTSASALVGGDVNSFASHACSAGLASSGGIPDQPTSGCAYEAASTTTLPAPTINNSGAAATAAPFHAEQQQPQQQQPAFEPVGADTNASVLASNLSSQPCNQPDISYNCNTGFWWQGFYFINYDHLLAYRRCAIAYNFHFFGIRPNFKPPSNLPRPRRRASSAPQPRPPTSRLAAAAAAVSTLVAPAAPTGSAATQAELLPTDSKAVPLHPSEAAPVSPGDGSGVRGPSSPDEDDEASSSCCGSPGDSSNSTSSIASGVDDSSDDTSSHDGRRGESADSNRSSPCSTSSPDQQQRAKAAAFAGQEKQEVLRPPCWGQCASVSCPAAVVLPQQPESTASTTSLPAKAVVKTQESAGVIASAAATTRSNVMTNASPTSSPSSPFSYVSSCASPILMPPLPSLRCRTANTGGAGSPVANTAGDALSPGYPASCSPPPFSFAPAAAGSGSPTACVSPLWMERHLGGILERVVGDAFWGSEDETA
ncbi:hypothetical protein Agub_g11312 [Astrephomene gubernaculifera]|uniref:Uncharacterized protein n=1 Tax=Astrephomene gubernaculifera TaxID=47775 RepID=A0AAD3DWB5_9CHLO|nr:hypothetical protein Agub_g11312 [Astrephomene gubernaculifera]